MLQMSNSWDLQLIKTLPRKLKRGRRSWKHSKIWKKWFHCFRQSRILPRTYCNCFD